MIKLRTFTIGTPLDFDALKIRKLKRLAKSKLNPRTCRINLPLTRVVTEKTIKTKIKNINELCKMLGIRWFNIPFNLINADSSVSNLIFYLLKTHPKSFINLIVAMDNILSHDAMMQASTIIKEVSKTQNGINNFRVGVSCNPCINTPFFPFTYSSEELGFSIGLELPSVIKAIIQNNKNSDITEMRDKIISTLVPEIKELEKTCYEIENITNSVYHGIDLSIAPFPNKDGSVGNILELLGLDAFGSNGTLFFTSFFTDILKTIAKEASIKSVGFNGVMYSLMEDTNLCKCQNRHIFSIDSLISYSSVCGCGLDMVPIPGNTYKEEIASLILDIAGMSTVLSKPLGVRVLPIPNKLGGEITEFDLDFLCNTRIKDVKNVVTWGNSFKQKFFSYKISHPKISGKEIKEFWDRRASYHSEDEGLTNLEEDKKLLKIKVNTEKPKVLSYVNPKDKTILDLGGGNGNWSFLFAKTAKSVAVIDYCKELISQGTKRAIRTDTHNIVFCESSIQDFTENKKYDTIFLSGVTIYLNDDEFNKVLENIEAYSKKGTELILRDATGIQGRYCLNKKYSKELEAHYSAIYRTKEEYANLFKKVGFYLIKDEDMFPEGSLLNKHKETRLRIYKFRRVNYHPLK